MARAEKVSYWRGKSTSMPDDFISGRLLYQEDTGDVYLEYREFDTESSASGEIVRRKLTDTSKFDISGGGFTGPVILSTNVNDIDLYLDYHTDAFEDFQSKQCELIETAGGDITAEFTDNSTLTVKDLIAVPRIYVDDITDNIDAKLQYHIDDILTDSDGNPITTIDASEGIHPVLRDDGTQATDTAGNLLFYKTDPSVQHITQETREYWNHKVDQVEGKQLSTNDFTNEYRNKLDFVAANATKVEYTPNYTSVSSEEANILLGTLAITSVIDVNSELSEQTLTYDIYMPAVAGSAEKLQIPQNIDGIQFDGTSSIQRFAYCSTSSNVQTKEVTINNYQNTDGAISFIYFENDNSVDSPKLKINDNLEAYITYKSAELHSDIVEASGITTGFSLDSDSGDQVAELDSTISTYLYDVLEFTWEDTSGNPAIEFDGSDFSVTLNIFDTENNFAEYEVTYPIDSQDSDDENPEPEEDDENPAPEEDEIENSFIMRLYATSDENELAFKYVHIPNSVMSNTDVFPEGMELSIGISGRKQIEGAKDVLSSGLHAFVYIQDSNHYEILDSLTSEYNIVNYDSDGLMSHIDKQIFDNINNNLDQIIGENCIIEPISVIDPITGETSTEYSYQYASHEQYGIVQIGDNITVANGVISINHNNVIEALGYDPGQGGGSGDIDVFRGASSAISKLPEDASNLSNLYPNSLQVYINESFNPPEGYVGLSIVNLGESSISLPAATVIPGTESDPDYEYYIYAAYVEGSFSTDTYVYFILNGDSFSPTSTLTLPAGGTPYSAYPAFLCAVSDEGDLIEGIYTLVDLNVENSNLGEIHVVTGSEGVEGLVPAPIDTESQYFLKGDGTWSPISDNYLDISGISNDILEAILGGQYDSGSGGGSGTMDLTPITTTDINTITSR